MFHLTLTTRPFRLLALAGLIGLLGGGAALAADGCCAAGAQAKAKKCPVTGATMSDKQCPVTGKTASGKCPMMGDAKAKDCPVKHDAAQTTAATKAEAKPAAYPLATCVVSGDKLGGAMGQPVDYDYKGRLVRFCCKSCIAKFEAEPDKYLKKIDVAVIKQQKAAYPLKTCVVSGQELGKMGPGYDYVYQNRLVRFCCKGCVKTFEKDPAKYLGKLDGGARQATAEKKTT